MTLMEAYDDYTNLLKRVGSNMVSVAMLISRLSDFHGDHHDSLQWADYKDLTTDSMVSCVYIYKN